LKRVIAIAGISLMLGACSVGLAMNGEEDPDLSVVKRGTTRANVESEIGKPIKTVRLANGTKADVYAYEVGNEPSIARAFGHAVADVFTLGIWEVAGTPMERGHEEKHYLTVYYDENDTVTAVEPSKRPTLATAAMAEESPKADNAAAKAPMAPVASPAPPVKMADPEPAPASPPPPPKTPPAKMASVPSGQADDSPFRIQLASYRSRSRAEREWRRLQAKWPEVLGERTLVIDKKKLAGRGTYFRVQTGGFDTRQDARSVCTILKSQNQACFSLQRP
jgi:cell division septation protein DedD